METSDHFIYQNVCVCDGGLETVLLIVVLLYRWLGLGLGLGNIEAWRLFLLIVILLYRW